MFLAFMITRSMNTDAAVKTVGSGYGDSRFDWKTKYVKTRASWIYELKKWEKEWQQAQTKWKASAKGKELLQNWQALLLGEAPIGTRVRKRKREGENLSEEAQHCKDRGRVQVQEEKEEVRPRKLCDVVRKWESRHEEEEEEERGRAEKRCRTDFQTRSSVQQNFSQVTHTHILLLLLLCPYIFGSHSIVCFWFGAIRRFGWRQKGTIS